MARKKKPAELPKKEEPGVLDIAEAAIVAAAGIIFFILLLSIAINGCVLHEPNDTILALELVLSVFLVALGVNRYLHKMKRLWK